MKLIHLVGVLFSCCFVLSGSVFAAEQNDDAAKEQGVLRNRCQHCGKFMRTGRRSFYCSFACSSRNRVRGALQSAESQSISASAAPAPVPDMVLPVVVAAETVDSGCVRRGRGFVFDPEAQEEIVNEELEPILVEDEDAVYCFDCHNTKSACCCLVDCHLCDARHPTNMTCEEFAEAIKFAEEAEVRKKRAKIRSSSRGTGIGYNPNNAALSCFEQEPREIEADEVCLVGGCYRHLVKGICPKGHMVYKISVGYDSREGNDSYSVLSAMKRRD